MFPVKRWRPMVNLKPPSPNLLSLFALILFTLIAARPAVAVRPFVTDDARVVGYHVGQLESSVKADKNVVANLNLFAFGPTENLGADRGVGGWFSSRERRVARLLGAGTTYAGQIPVFCGEAQCNARDWQPLSEGFRLGVLTHSNRTRQESSPTLQ